MVPKKFDYRIQEGKVIRCGSDIMYSTDIKKVEKIVGEKRCVRET